MKKLFTSLFDYAREALYRALTLFTYRAGLVLYMDGVATFASDQFPTVSDLNNYAVQNPGAVQVTKQTLYDTLNYPAAGLPSLQFFSVPLGQGQSQHPGVAAGVTKTYYDTNLDVAGQLPRFVSFVVESIEVLMLPGSVLAATLFANVAPAQFTAVAIVTPLASANDVYAFYNSGFLELNVSNGNLLRDAPLRKFPAKANLDVSSAISSNSATTGENSVILTQAMGRPYYLQPLITLAENASFNVTIRWPNNVAMPSTFNASVKVILDGYLLRATQ